MLSYVVIASPHGDLSAGRLVTLSTRCEDGLPFVPTSSHVWLSPTGHVGVLGWERQVHLPVGSNVHVSPRGLTAFDGVPLFANRPGPGVDWAQFLQRQLPSSNPLALLRAVRGVYSVVHLDGRGAGLVSSDPLGAMPTYLGRADGLTVLSNRPMLVERALTEQHLARDVEAVGWILATGYGIGVQTGFVGVERVHTDEYAQVDADGVIGVRKRWRPRVPANPIARTDLPDLAHEVSAELADNLRAILAIDAPLVVGLTGGRDTRVLVALARAGRVDKDLDYQTMGALGSADVVVAERLADRFRWRHRIVGAHRPVQPPEWLSDRLRQTAFASCGTVAGKELRLPGVSAAHVFVTGQFGELYRTTEANHRPISKMADVDAYFAQRVLLHDSGGLVRPDVERHYLAQLHARVEANATNAQEPGDALHLFFADKMIMNLWGAQELLNGAQPRLYPLYSPLAFEVALGLGHDGRRFELLPLSLIRQLDDELAEIPLADRAFPREAFALLPGADRYPTEPELGTPGIAGLKGSSLATHRPAFEDLLLDPTNPVFDILDFERVASLVRSQEPIARRHERDLYNAAGAAVWLGRLEQRPTTAAPEPATA